MQRMQYEDVIRCIENGDSYYDGAYAMWVRKVWKLVDREGLDRYKTIPEQMTVCSLIFGICVIYHETAARLQGNSDPDDTDLEMPPALFSPNGQWEDPDDPEYDGSSELAVRDFIRECVYTESGIYRIFAVLKKYLGREKTFALLYYCLNYDQYSLADWETEEFFYGDIEDPDELEQARCENEDYENRKEFASYSYEEMLEYILNTVDFQKMEAYDWLSEFMN